MENLTEFKNLMPKEVADKWIPDNVCFPDYAPRNPVLPSQSDVGAKSPRRKRMIIAHGAEDSGKTTAICDVFADLIFRSIPFEKISYTFIGGASIGRACDDIIAVMDITGWSDFPEFRLGIYSCGDGVNLINPVRERLIQMSDCDVIICAAQSDKPAIYSKLVKFAVEADSPYRVSTVSLSGGGTLVQNTAHYRAKILAALTDWA